MGFLNTLKIRTLSLISITIIVRAAITFKKGMTQLNARVIHTIAIRIAYLSYIG